MTKLLNLSAIISIVFIVSCSEKEAKNERTFMLKGKAETESTLEANHQNTLASKKIDLKNKGIGPIKSIQLKAEIDQTMATHGAELYKNKCTSCHRPNKKFIGPASAGILDRRTPEYIMNKMLNPLEMMRKDLLSKELLKEFDYAIMPYQNLKEHEARAVLEYFRTLN